MTTETKVYCALAVALAAVFGLSLISYLSLREYLAATAGIERVRALQGSLNEYFDAIQDAETGQRGYLITGQDAIWSLTKIVDAH